jgi:outer membrane protein OmpA-like peptidoglycan-associated protein
MNLKLTLASLVALGLVAATAATPAMAEEAMTKEQILQKLMPKAKTRSIAVKKKGEPEPMVVEEKAKKELDKVLGGSIDYEDRKKIVEITKKQDYPTLDFAINFGFNSATIDASSYPSLDTLAEAMKTPELSEARFLINGHTDSKGSDDYNLSLSQKRANSVVSYLVGTHDIAPARLKAIGFGETAPKNELDGEAAENRRVEIINRP